MKTMRCRNGHTLNGPDDWYINGSRDFVTNPRSVQKRSESPRKRCRRCALDRELARYKPNRLRADMYRNWAEQTWELLPDRDRWLISIGLSDLDA